MFEFHIGNCLAPCVGKQNNQDYEQDVEQIRQILKGNIRSVVQHFKTEMFSCRKDGIRKSPDYKER